MPFVSSYLGAENLSPVPCFSVLCSSQEERRTFQYKKIDSCWVFVLVLAPFCLESSVAESLLSPEASHSVWNSCQLAYPEIKSKYLP